MKFETLNLIRFGLYTDYVIDFRSKNDAGFHLLYGPNEAGKSTALRAINHLLYGFPKSTRDDYLHNQKDLRVGAVIQGKGGNVFEVVRRKGNKNTLMIPVAQCHYKFLLRNDRHIVLSQAPPYQNVLFHPYTNKHFRDPDFEIH